MATELLHQGGDVLERMQHSKLITTSQEFNDVKSFWDDAAAFEQLQKRHERSLENNIRTRLQLETIHNLTDNLCASFELTKTFCVCSKSEIQSSLSLLRSNSSESLTHFSEIRDGVGRILNVASQGKGHLRTLDTKKRASTQKLESFLNTIAGAAEESLASFDLIRDKLNNFAARCERLSQEINPCIALIDRAGRGKTNLVCDLIQRLSKNQPVFFIAAKSIPVQADDPITKHIVERLQSLPGFHQDDIFAILSQIAYVNSSAIIIVMDGINESMNPFTFVHHLHSFLARVNYLQIRVVVTCREEYWTVFKNLEDLMVTLFRGNLGLFNTRERDQAIKKYFSRYRISTQLDPEPLKALRDPLLLRFFCEAYGNRSEAVGARVQHIRLKPLFDEYQRVKYCQIASQHQEVRSANAVADYVNDIARLLLKFRTTALTRAELTTFIPHSELYRVGSLYSRLLDEDVVIEQRYTEHSNSIVVNFTYEAFMEYVLGSLIHEDQERTHGNVSSFLARWFDQNHTFPNSAGVVGFFIANLFERDREEVFEAIRWLHSTGKEDHLYSLQIALDNLPPEEFDRRTFSLLLTRLSLATDPKEHPQTYTEQQRKNQLGVVADEAEMTQQGKNKQVFGPDEALRILLRSPASLSELFTDALQSVKPDTKLAPLTWARVLEHFGTESPDLMWKAIYLRFSTRQPLRKFTSAHARRFLTWIEQSDSSVLTPYGEEIAQSLIQQWKGLRNEIIAGGRHGGWDVRAMTVSEFIGQLQRRLRSASAS